MCGRYTQTLPAEKLSSEFRIPKEQLPPIVPRYNISPSQPVLALFEENGKRKADFLHWGLIPSWAKEALSSYRTINARKETLTEKPSFRGPLRNSRCLVLADGFYEWKEGPRFKQPYYVRLKSRRPFGFAGLWSEWASPDGAELRSCTIITTEPNGLLSRIHNRMPAIVKPTDRELWLDSANSDVRKLMGLLRSYPEEDMEAYPVSGLVNSPSNDDPACIETDPVRTGSGVG